MHHRTPLNRVARAPARRHTRPFIPVNFERQSIFSFPNRELTKLRKASTMVAGQQGFRSGAAESLSTAIPTKRCLGEMVCRDLPLSLHG